MSKEKSVDSGVSDTSVSMPQGRYVGNQLAPDGQVYVCAACGKRSKDQYGHRKLDRGWDESCMLHSVLCFEKKTAEGHWEAVPA